ncbi:hypothetical protein Memar_0004 [Methanoculleus marisnigri JR1]|uniref:Uncharacterized protein n=1 Tax=Methanoculleus marisnigri (strain ATCC 35101 / DSM 1498 / JR1) TaxID=368407 RepID=A3CRD9_METMJ|nr:hypothetical protein Memar_0004 [Methanoculleus marisnigri JR1]
MRQPVIPLRRKFHWKQRGQDPVGDRVGADPQKPGLIYNDLCRWKPEIYANIAVQRRRYSTCTLHLPGHLPRLLPGRGPLVRTLQGLLKPGCL